MNFLAIFSFFLGFSVLGYGLLSSTNKVGMFYDFPSLLIVAGGSFAAIAIAFELKNVMYLFKSFLQRMLNSKMKAEKDIITDMIEIAEAYRTGNANLKPLIEKSGDPFLKDCMEIFLDEIFDMDELLSLLKRRNQNMFTLYNQDAAKFKGMGKFPPAFGMMGTTIGMIVLLSNLGGANAAAMIGPAMSVCLITTLYGVTISNLIIIPIGDNLGAQAQYIKRKNNMIIKGLELIALKKNPIIFTEELNSYLLPHERLSISGS